MTLNDILTKQNVITKLIMKDGDKELSKELKVKIMKIRIEYNKIKKQFDEDAKEFADQIVPQELRDLANKERTEEEEVKFNELNSKANTEYQEYALQKGKDEVVLNFDDSVSEEEYSDILDINSNNEVDVNGTKIPAADFMEIFYELFVKE